jgi:glycosyltransferase involved in cell wall biosynthesis
MQEVLIDVTRLVHRFMGKRLPTGVDRVSLAYIKHYYSRARAVLRHNGGKFVFRHRESERLFDWVLSLGKSGSPMWTIYSGLITGCLAQNVAGRFLFNTGHSGLESDNYITMLTEQKVRPIFMIHDVIPLSHPQFCRIGEQKRHLARLRNAMQIAHGIVFNSQATKDELSRLCGIHDWKMPPSAVALLAPELPPALLGPRPMVPPYFVFVSTIEPRKNHLMLLNIWEKLALQIGDQAPRLVIIGQRGWDYEEVADMLAQSDTLKRLVIEIPACSDTDMVNYLQEAQALVFPSFAEGFGMPVVEALAHGVPVIASDLLVFREFAADIPEYVDAGDPCKWEQILIDYANPENPRRRAQMARLQGFRAPSWSDHFHEVDGLLETVFGHETSGA